MSSSTVIQQADTTPPTVFIVSPIGGIVSGNVNISAAVSDNQDLAGIQFKVNDINLGAEFNLSQTVATSSVITAQWNTLGFFDGFHNLTAVVKDKSGNIASSTPIKVAVANKGFNLPPIISIINPVNNSTVLGVISIAASSSRASAEIAGVQFKLDNIGIGYEGTVAPYQIDWNSASVIDGFHILSAVARDAVGNNATSAGIKILIDNTPPEISAVQSANITSSSAVISFITNEPATSQIEYGQTIAYGSSSFISQGSVHNLILNKLAVNQSYHYRINAKDAIGNSTSGSDFVFTTTAATSTIILVSTTTLITAPEISSTTIQTSTVLTASTTVTTATSTIKFPLQQRIQTTAKLSVRNIPSLTGVNLGYQNSGALGVIIGGPVQAGGYNWWQINYDNSPDGWSVENWLVASTAPLATIKTATNITTQTTTTSQATTTQTTPTASSTKFLLNSRVQTTAMLTVKNSPTGFKLGSQLIGAKGTVIGGPVSAFGYWWWQINYDNSPDGWSVENWLVASTAPAPTITNTTTTIQTSTVLTASTTVTTATSTIKFPLQQRIQTTAKLSVRNIPSLTGVNLGYQNSGALGVIIGGPVQAGGYNWWQINYDNSPDGWSVENWLVNSF